VGVSITPTCVPVPLLPCLPAMSAASQRMSFYDVFDEFDALSPAMFPPEAAAPPALDAYPPCEEVLSVSASPEPEAAPAQAPVPAPAGSRGARHWCFTLNHPSGDDEAHLGSLCDEIEAGHLRYLVMGREVGESGTAHLQGYLELKTPERLVWLRGHVHQYAHFEQRRGTREQARDYCMKDGDWIETGVWREEERGRRRDIEAMVEAASEGKSFYDAACEDASVAAFPQAYTKLLEGRALANTPAWRQVKVVVKIGPTGCGKTRSAMSRWPACFLQDCTIVPLWWDGYEGQKILILDEFSGQIPFHHLLRLLDGYPMRIPVKGAFTYGVWTEVIITSNHSVVSWYPKVPDIAPLLRRITEVQRYVGVDDIIIEHFHAALL